MKGWKGEEGEERRYLASHILHLDLFGGGGNALTFRLYHTLAIAVKIFNLRFNERRNLFFEISL
jgi:hypothetical protein